MKYLLIVLALASIAGIEVFHALASGDEPGAMVCTAQEAQAASVRDMLFAHIRNH